MQFDFGTDLKNDERKPFMSSSKVVTILFLGSCLTVFIVIRKKEPLRTQEFNNKECYLSYIQVLWSSIRRYEPTKQKGSLGENGKNMLYLIVKSSREIKGYLYY
jgi:hypothetical protein